MLPTSNPGLCRLIETTCAGLIPTNSITRTVINIGLSLEVVLKISDTFTTLVILDIPNLTLNDLYVGKYNESIYNQVKLKIDELVEEEIDSLGWLLDSTGLINVVTPDSNDEVSMDYSQPRHTIDYKGVFENIRNTLHVFGVPKKSIDNDYKIVDDTMIMVIYVGIVKLVVQSKKFDDLDMDPKELYINIMYNVREGLVDILEDEIGRHNITLGKNSYVIYDKDSLYNFMTMVKAGWHKNTPLRNINYLTTMPWIINEINFDKLTLQIKNI